MKYIINIGKSILSICLCFTLLSLILTSFNYFNILNNQVITIIKIIIPFSSMAIGGFLIGKLSEKNGWIQGLLLGISISIIIFILNLIFKDFEFKNFIYYIILIISSIFGSIIGINKKD